MPGQQVIGALSVGLCGGVFRLSLAQLPDVILTVLELNNRVVLSGGRGNRAKLFAWISTLSVTRLIWVGGGRYRGILFRML